MKIQVLTDKFLFYNQDLTTLVDLNQTLLEKVFPGHTKDQITLGLDEGEHRPVLWARGSRPETDEEEAERLAAMTQKERVNALRVEELARTENQQRYEIYLKLKAEFEGGGDGPDKT